MCPGLRISTPAAGDSQAADPSSTQSQVTPARWPALEGPPEVGTSCPGRCGGRQLGSAGGIPEPRGVGPLLTCSSVPQPGNQTCLE